MICDNSIDYLGYCFNVLAAITPTALATRAVMLNLTKAKPSLVFGTLGTLGVGVGVGVASGVAVGGVYTFVNFTPPFGRVL